MSDILEPHDIEWLRRYNSWWSKALRWLGFRNP
jgi:hypothetical protein